MKKLCELMSSHSYCTLGTGIEVEVEGTNLPEPRKTNYWSMVGEGSLRDGVEYITAGPLDAENRTKALNLLYKNLYQKGVTVNEDQSRCSIHVHVSVNNLTPMQIHTALCVSILLDSLLMKYCGPDRESNLFCQPIVYTQGTINSLIGNVRSPSISPFSKFSLDRFKYSSINIASVYRNGSIEFRGMRYLTTAQEVDSWCSNLFDMVHKSAVLWSSPKDFMDWYLTHSKKELFESLFTKEFAKELLDLEEQHKIMQENATLCSKYAYKPDWETFKTKYTGEENKLSGYKTMTYVVDDIPDVPLMRVEDIDDFFERD